MIKNVRIILLLIILIAIFFRLINLGQWPNLNHDEAIEAYDAYSILQISRDHRGNFLPFCFPAYSDKIDNRPPLNIYLLVPFIKIFGLNEFSIRLLSVIIGIFTIIVSYFLTQELFENKKIALLASFFLAISPGHIILSRLAHETILVPLFFSLGFLFLLKGLKDDKYYILSSISFGLLTYTHQSAKILLSIFLIGALLIILINKKINFKKNFWISLLIFLILIIPYFVNFRQLPIGRALESGFIFLLPLKLAALFLIYNLYNYLTIPNFYEYFSIFLLTIIGLGLLCSNIKNLKNQLLLLTFFSSLAPGILFLSNPHIFRTSNLILTCAIISSFSFHWLLKKIKKSFSFFIIIILIITNFLNILIFFSHTSPPFFNPLLPAVPFPPINFRQLINYLNITQNQFRHIVFILPSQPLKKIGTNQIYAYILFYSKYPPSKLQAQNVKRIYWSSNWQLVTEFDKYRFCYEPVSCDFNENDLLVVTRSESLKFDGKKIYYEDF